MPRLWWSPCLLLAVLFLCIHGSVHVVRAQNRTGATTHPDEGDRSLHLDWSTRFEICLGVARGLVYLREGSHRTQGCEGQLCTQASHSLRPPMSRVVAMLSGDVEVSDVTSKPGYLTDWRFDDITRDVEVSDITSKSGYLTDWRFDGITTTSSLSSFQTKETNTSGSKISPGKNDSQPMLGAIDVCIY